MEEHLQEALEIAKAQASVRNMTEDEISSMIATVAKRIKEISKEIEQQQEQTQEQQEPPVDPKKSIREKSVVCLECGRTFKVLSKKHLETHGLSCQQYKEKWGLPKNQALIAKSLAKQRKKKMEEMELWKKRGNVKQTG